jgi:aminodeoxyfutalosine synthase
LLSAGSRILVREKLHGDIAYFNVNRHINPTNVCVASCRLCAFGRKKGDAGTYTMALEEAWETAASGYSEAVTEFHIVGGLHPDLPFRILHGPRARPEGTLPEGPHQGLHHGGGCLPRQARQDDHPGSGPADEGCRCGFDAWRWGGDLRRPRPAHHLRPQDRWRRVAGYSPLAHKLGCGRTRRCSTATSRTTKTASTIMLRLREVQDETGGFQTFIPLAFHPDNTALGHIPRTTGMLDIRQIAVGRLMLDNFSHIKAYWQMMTPKIAQILRCASAQTTSTAP